MKSVKRWTRINAIYEELVPSRYVSISSLAEKFRVSPSTIRRDLQIMVLLPDFPIDRISGGVSRSTEHGEGHRDRGGTDFRRAALMEPIAVRAAEYIETGELVMLHGGDLCLRVAQKIGRKQAPHIVTADLRIAREICGETDIELYMLGGAIAPGRYIVSHPIPERSLEEYNVDKLFISADGISLEKGLSYTRSECLGAIRDATRISREIILLAEYDKFERAAMFRSISLEEIDAVITNRELDPDTAAAVREMNVELILV